MIGNILVSVAFHRLFLNLKFEHTLKSIYFKDFGLKPYITVIWITPALRPFQLRNNQLQDFSSKCQLLGVDINFKKVVNYKGFIPVINIIND